MSNNRTLLILARTINGIAAGGQVSASIAAGYENSIRSAPDGLQLPVIDLDTQFVRGSMTTEDWIHVIELLTGNMEQTSSTNANPALLQPPAISNTPSPTRSSTGQASLSHRASTCGQAAVTNVDSRLPIPPGPMSGPSQILRLPRTIFPPHAVDGV